MSGDSAAHSSKPPSTLCQNGVSPRFAKLGVNMSSTLRCGKTSGLGRGKSWTHELNPTSFCIARAKTVHGSQVCLEEFLIGCIEVSHAYRIAPNQNLSRTRLKKSESVYIV